MSIKLNYVFSSFTAAVLLFKVSALFSSALSTVDELHGFSAKEAIWINVSYIFDYHLI